MSIMSDGLIGTLDVLRRRFQQQKAQRGFFAACLFMIRLVCAVLLTPWYRWSRRNRTFTFHGKKLRYCNHWYNTTFDNERALEIPIALDAIASAPKGRILEIGNVLSHYASIRHVVLDKFEKGADIIHEDVATFRADTPFDLIISLSTLEHVGYDETPRDPEKILRTMANLRSLLAPGGRLLATIPIGYNPLLSPLIARGALFDEQFAFIRVSADNRFEETTIEEALKRKFNDPYSFGNAVIVGRIGPWKD